MPRVPPGLCKAALSIRSVYKVMSKVARLKKCPRSSAAQNHRGVSYCWWHLQINWFRPVANRDREQCSCGDKVKPRFGSSKIVPDLTHWHLANSLLKNFPVSLPTIIKHARRFMATYGSGSAFVAGEAGSPVSFLLTTTLCSAPRIQALGHRQSYCEAVASAP
jgi:hypothetical protein